jgi:uncharacterized protein (TIGR03435 family)
VKKHLLRVATLSVAGLWSQKLASGQTVPPAKPKFEVASIKECKGADHAPPSTSSPGRLGLSCWPLMRLIQEAYEVFASGEVDPRNPSFPFAPVEGAPNWVNSVRYSIDAKAEAPERGAMMRGPMMQTLLEERFQLKTHREARGVPAYIMTVTKDGPKLQPTKEGTCNQLDPTDLTQSIRIPPGGKPWCVIPPPVRNGTKWAWDVSGMSLDVFSKLLKIGGRPVLDRTGLTGTFDIHLEWTADDPDASPPDGGAASEPPNTSIVSAIRKQLGLQLGSGKGPREFVIIDHVERPSGN